MQNNLRGGGLGGAGISSRTMTLLWTIGSPGALAATDSKMLCVG